MNATEQILDMTIAAPGIEVVTLRTAEGQIVSKIHGGRLDGETYPADRDPDGAHHRACVLARMSLWPRRRA